MGSGTPPPGPKPSAIPAHVLSGSSSLNPSSAGHRAAHERESLNSSILSSFSPRIPAAFESSDTVLQSTGESNSQTAHRNEQDGPNPAVRNSGDAK